MTFKSNLRDVQRCVTSLGADTFNMRRRRRTSSRTVGQGLAETVAALVRFRTVEQQRDKDGRPLAPLKVRYLLWKLRHGHPPTISILTGEMMELEQLEGDVTVTANSVSLIYGKDEEMKREMEWFSEGFRGTDRLGRQQDRPPRPVFELGKDGEKAVDLYLDEVADQHIKDLGG